MAYVAICPRCDVPSMITGDGEMTVPPSTFGEAVGHLPDDVEALYNEARTAVTSGAPNCAAVACRKILMHVGVEKGAAENGASSPTSTTCRAAAMYHPMRASGSTRFGTMATTRTTRSHPAMRSGVQDFA